MHCNIIFSYNDTSNKVEVTSLQALYCNIKILKNFQISNNTKIEFSNSKINGSNITVLEKGSLRIKGVSDFMKYNISHLQVSAGGTFQINDLNNKKTYIKKKDIKNNPKKLKYARKNILEINYIIVVTITISLELFILFLFLYCKIERKKKIPKYYSIL
uniref:Auto-transporter adhesin head GIN domain-containing protein n=1 Tax=Faxonius propinquus nudivirus TaxID=3139431 RepID=A0AAU8GD22_9VIRU